MRNEKPSFLVQLQQRHVFRVAAMYAVTSWLLLQIGSTTFEPLGFPEWSQRALIILLAAGFPIALVLAWIFDVTPEGVVETAHPTNRLSRGRKLDIVIIVVLLAALVVTFVWRREPPSVAPVVQDSSIAVLPFVAMSDDASLRHLGEGLSEQITNELARNSGLRVASRTSAFEQTEKGCGRDRAQPGGLVCAGRQRAPERRQGPHHRPAGARAGWCARVVGYLRCG